MKALEIAFEIPKISINGNEYEILKSDKTIVEDMLKIDKEFEGCGSSDLESVLKKNEKMLDYLNELLGEGARDKIVESIPGLKKYGLGFGGLNGILSKIIQSAGKSYTDAITTKYDD